MKKLSKDDIFTGDCDSDGDCLSGFKCGDNNCPDEITSSFDATDDCCYDPKLLSK